MLADVPDWRGLADWLNIRSHDIEGNCATDVAHAACHRRTLVRRYCDGQLSQNPSKVAEDIAKALEMMNHGRQAERLRHLQRGELVAKTQLSRKPEIGWLVQKRGKEGKKSYLQFWVMEWK